MRWVDVAWAPRWRHCDGTWVFEVYKANSGHRSPFFVPHLHTIAERRPVSILSVGSWRLELKAWARVCAARVCDRAGGEGKMLGGVSLYDHYCLGAGQTPFNMFNSFRPPPGTGSGRAPRYPQPHPALALGTRRRTEHTGAPHRKPLPLPSDRRVSWP